MLSANARGRDPAGERRLSAAGPRRRGRPASAARHAAVARREAHVGLAARAAAAPRAPARTGPGTGCAPSRRRRPCPRAQLVREPGARSPRRRAGRRPCRRRRARRAARAARWRTSRRTSPPRRLRPGGTASVRATWLSAPATDPADLASITACSAGQQQVPPSAGGVPGVGEVLRRSPARPRCPVRARARRRPRAARRRSARGRQAQIHPTALHRPPAAGGIDAELLHPDRRRLELRRARLRVPRVVGQDVDVDLLGEVRRERREPGPQRRVERAPAPPPRRAATPPAPARRRRCRARRRPRRPCAATRGAAAARRTRRSARRSCSASSTRDRWSAGSGTRRSACPPAARAPPA